MSKGFKIFLAAVGVLFIVISVVPPLLEEGPQTNMTPAPSVTTVPVPAPSIEQNLVTQSGGTATAQQFAAALDSLESKCPETRQQLANMGVKARELLRRDGVNEPLLDTFRGLDTAIPAGGGVGECSSVLATYIALRVQQ